MEASSTTGTAAGQTPDMEQAPKKVAPNCAVRISSYERRRQHSSQGFAAPVSPMRVATTFVDNMIGLSTASQTWRGVRNITKEFVHCRIRCSMFQHNLHRLWNVHVPLIIKSRRQRRSVASTWNAHDGRRWTIQHGCRRGYRRRSAVREARAAWRRCQPEWRQEPVLT